MAHQNLTSDENKAILELKEVLEKLLDNRLIIFNLYGSKTKGDYDSKSDTDIAIIILKIQTQP